MDPFLAVLAAAVIPVGGTYLGAVLAERMALSPSRLSLALHAATGVVFAVIAVELLPTTLEEVRPDGEWVVLVGFAAGGLFYLLFDRLTGIVRARLGARHRKTGATALFMATAVDLLSDGVMIGAGAALRPELGLLLALGQMPADIPEGFALNSTLRQQGLGRGRRLLGMAALGIPILVGATAGHFLLRDRGPLLQGGVLAFTAGLLAVLLIEELSPHAHAHTLRDEPEPRLAGLVFLGGFCLFFLVSILFNQ